MVTNCYQLKLLINLEKVYACVHFYVTLSPPRRLFELVTICHRLKLYIIFRKTELFITFDIDNYYSVVDGLTIKMYYLEQKFSHVKEIEGPNAL